MEIVKFLVVVFHLNKAVERETICKASNTLFAMQNLYAHFIKKLKVDKILSMLVATHYLLNIALVIKTVSDNVHHLARQLQHLFSLFYM